MTRRSNSGEAPASHAPAPIDSALAGADRIAAAFELTAAEDRAALMPYMMAGYPSREASSPLLELMWTLGPI